MTTKTDLEQYEELLTAAGLTPVRGSRLSRFWGTDRENEITIRVNEGEGVSLSYKFRLDADDKPVPLPIALVHTPSELARVLPNWVERVKQGE